MTKNTGWVGKGFQSLEKSGRTFPNIGKNGGRFSKHWKFFFAMVFLGCCSVPGALANGYSTYYVDAQHGNDANDGGSWANAKQTIQNAVDNIDNVPGRVVLVTNGVYELGGAVAPTCILTNRVMINKAITVRSVNGPEVTIIKGAFGATATNANDSVRGVYLTSGAILAGFTITNGASAAGGDVGDYMGGGVYLAAGGLVSNCVVSGNVGYHGGGGAFLNEGGMINNSVFRGNLTPIGDGGGGFIYHAGEINNCLFTGNSAPQSKGGGIIIEDDGTVNNCTVVGNRAANGHGGGVIMWLSGTLNNSIVWSNTGGDIIISEGTVRYTCAGSGVTHGANGCITNNPLFVDAGAGNYQLQPSSPCINAGDNAYAPTAVSPHDLAGHARIVFGTVDMGAYERQYRLSAYSGPFVGGNLITVTNGALGNGTDITNIVLGGVGTTNITGQGSNWVSFVTPAATSVGLKDIVIQSTSLGNTTFVNAYTVNPAGQIGVMVDDWNQWSEVAGLPIGRAHLAAASFNGCVYAIGGYCFSSAQANVYRFDGTNWTEVNALPAVRYALAACEFDGGLYAMGGENGDFPFYYNTTYRFDGTNWTEVATLPNAVSAEAAGSLNGKLYTLGGYENFGDVGQTVYEFDGASWSWPGHDLPEARVYLAAGTLNGRLYAVGGQGTSLFNANVYAFDGTNWQEVAGLPAPRGYLAASVLNGRLYAIGGRSDSAVHTNVYRYDGTNWQEVAGLPAARYNLAAATLDGVIYAIGGYPSGAMNERTNVFRYPGRVLTLGVTPFSGSMTGGYPVVISGSNLCNGTLGDVTNVTLCGVAATVTGVAGSTQIVVTVGAAGGSLTGDVRVCSASFGETTKVNAFIYEAPASVVLFDFSLRAENGQVQVCWQTASELNTLGFDVFRWDEAAGPWIKVNSAMVAAQGWPNGGVGASYCVADPGARVDGTYRYKLVEYETTGGIQEYGPFERSVWTPRVSRVTATPAGMVLQWLSREAEVYDVLKALSARGDYVPAAQGLPATPPVNAWTDQTPTASGFYRVEAR